VATGLEDALAGSPIYVVPAHENLENFVESVAEEVGKIRIATDVDGVVLKTDALGSLEAIAESLKRNKVPVRLADVGDVSKRDVTEAVAVKEGKTFSGVILAFNVKVLPDAEEEARNRGVLIFRNTIIYHLIDDYVLWLKSTREKRLEDEFNRLIKPAKIRFLPGYTFRKVKPAIIGIEMLAGHIEPKYVLIKEDGRTIGEILQIQDRGNSVSEANTGMQVAVSLNKAIVGRHIHEGETFYVQVPETHAKILITKFRDRLSLEEADALGELIALMRDKHPMWAI
jgi:translation initiation factor 5B